MRTRPTSSGGMMPGNTLSPGTMLAGRYQVEKVIGTGGMSVVYSARDRRFRAIVRRCAIKEMFDSIADTAARQRARENFEREANLLASLNHAAIPKVYDYFTESERHYLVYEHIEGQDLARLLHQRARPMSPDRVVDWGIQLARVLAMLHRSDPPIIFRDLKPSNVMLREEGGQIILIDFGIAKHFQPVQKGTMIGTEGYAPPEQYEGVASPQVDVYSLGATLHQLLTNTDPQEFRPFSFNQRPIRQYNPAVSSDLDEILIRALSYEPNDRWETMDDMRRALERVQRSFTNPNLGSAGTGTRPVSPPTGAFRPSDGSPSGTGSGLFARLRERDSGGTRPVGSGDGGTRPVDTGPDVGTRPVQSPQDATRPVQPPVDATRPVGADKSQPPRPAAGAAAPAVPTVGFDEGEITGESAFVPVWTFATEDEIRSTPELTDDSIFVGSYDNNLYCVDRATGDFRWKYATHGGVPGTPAIWRELVIIGSEDSQVYGINRRTGRMEWTSQTQGRVRASPRISVDHVFIGSDDGHVYAFTAVRGHLLWKTSLGSPVRSSAAIGDQMLFVGAEDGTIAGLNVATGEVAWRVRTSASVISSPVLVGERVVVGSMDRQLYGIDQRSGWVVWRVKLADRIYSSPCLIEDRLYICSVDGSLYCLDAEWGKEIWKCMLGTQVTSSPIVAADGLHLFIGGIDGAIYCVNTKKAKVMWRFSTGGPIPGSPREAEGVVYFGSMDYRLYALPTEAAPRKFS